MAKLTRTQKFADLRDSLANDKEPSLSTKELNVYEDRLASLTGETLRQQEQESVRKVLDDDPKYIWTAFEESDDNAYDPYSYSKQNDDFLNNRYVWNSLQEFPESNNSYEIENTFNIDELPDINEGRSVEDDLTQIQPFEPIIEDNTMETPVIENVQEEIVETKVEDNPYEVVEETVQEVQVEQPVEETPVEETVEQQTEVEETYDSQQSSDLYEEAQLEVDPISTEEFIEQQEARYKELSNTNPAIEEAYAQAEKLAEQGEQNVEQFTEQVQQEVEQLDQDVQETVEQVTQDIQQEVEQLSEEVVEDVKEVVEETPVEEVVEETIEYKQPTEEYTSSQEQQQETYTEETVDQDFNPAVEETVEEELQTERVDTEAEKLAAMQFLNDIVDNNEQVTYETEAGEQTVEETVEEVQEAVEQTVEEVKEESFVEQTSQQVQEEVHEELPVEEDTVSQEEVENVVEENSVVEMSADNHQPDDIDHGYNSSLIHETINEVGEYNRSVGEETITTLTSNLVNQIRHPERRSERRRYNEVPVEEVNASEDEEFSNTVSLEITKIMDEISNTQEVEKIVESKEEVLEHPVLTKALEDESQEDVVEIKNIKELEAEEATASNTLSNTIPFVVAAGEEDLIEEDEEDDSNTILNIILIVLIMILIAVLGLIIFYILRTRGII